MFTTFFPPLGISWLIGTAFIRLFHRVQNRKTIVFVRIAGFITAFVFGVILGLVIFTFILSISSGYPFSYSMETLTIQDYPGSMYVRSGTLGAFLGAGFSASRKWPVSDRLQNEAVGKASPTEIHKSVLISDESGEHPQARNRVFTTFKAIVALLIAGWVTLYFSQTGILIRSHVITKEGSQMDRIVMESFGLKPKQFYEYLRCTYFIGTGMINEEHSYDPEGKSGKIACPRSMNF